MTDSTTTELDPIEDAMLDVAMNRLRTDGEAPPHDRHAAVLRAHRLIRGGSPDPRFLTLVRGVPSLGADTLAWAQAQLIERYVARWGEQDRAASERRVRAADRTVGLALNRLAYWDIDHPDEYLAAQAVVMMTDADVRCLRQAS